MAASLTATGGTLGTVTAVGTLGTVTAVGTDRVRWQASVTPAGDGDVTVSLAASPAYDESGAVCTVAGQKAPARSITVKGGSRRLWRVPGGHRGVATHFIVLLVLSRAPEDWNDVIDSVSVTNGRLGAWTSEGIVSGRDTANINAHPSSDEDVTLTLPPSLDCSAPDAACTADGTGVLGATATVPRGEFVTVGFQHGTHGVFGNEFDVVISLSEALDPSTANVPANVEVAIEGELLSVALTTAGDYNSWTVRARSGVTIAAADIELHPSPACDQPGAMCTSGGKLVPYASTEVMRGSARGEPDGDPRVDGLRRGSRRPRRAERVHGGHRAVGGAGCGDREPRGQPDGVGRHLPGRARWRRLRRLARRRDAGRHRRRDGAPRGEPRVHGHGRHVYVRRPPGGGGGDDGAGAGVAIAVGGGRARGRERRYAVVRGDAGPGGGGRRDGRLRHRRRHGHGHGRRRLHRRRGHAGDCGRRHRRNGGGWPCSTTPWPSSTRPSR